ncbi:arsenic resistance N-acetyltransferase ArsN2 [Burkholderia contaminans]|uniref:arsenic resistance N-acetyltransferase ArsN2 n=1 Tax=Burkholderia contaminans TaxID=488447 RepID=UPI001CF41B38|nr:arsenic resistance N-acetyltransferase ArsN2 [Burkholderia contaminans]MCA7914619.1 arsenic resistance N-acetyltransferase ArsN2 [Burkholderia contaminans]UUX36435.1 arsenic resistance N-acetyltransferase ArsN2 [Burkholderia contaminans]
MEIRPATVDDLSSIETLLRQCGLPVVGVGDHLQNFVVAIEDSMMCGCGGIEHYGEAALMRSVAVAEHARDSGLGQTIVSRLVTECHSRKVRSLVLLTTTAEDYFARQGFVSVARDDVPPTVLASSQFRGVCPGSAVSMLRVL